MPSLKTSGARQWPDGCLTSGQSSGGVVGRCQWRLPIVRRSAGGGFGSLLSCCGCGWQCTGGLYKRCLLRGRGVQQPRRVIPCNRLVKRDYCGYAPLAMRNRRFHWYLKGWHFEHPPSQSAATITISLLQSQFLSIKHPTRDLQVLVLY
jgi:hypothetical protein